MVQLDNLMVSIRSFFNDLTGQMTPAEAVVKLESSGSFAQMEERFTALESKFTTLNDKFTSMTSENASLTERLAVATTTIETATVTEQTLRETIAAHESTIARNIATNNELAKTVSELRARSIDPLPATLNEGGGDAPKPETKDERVARLAVEANAFLGTMHTIVR